MIERRDWQDAIRDDRIREIERLHNQLAAAQPQLQAGNRVANAWMAIRADPYVCWSLRADVVAALDALAAAVPPAETEGET
jgi:hypothetical protein